MTANHPEALGRAAQGINQSTRGFKQMTKDQLTQAICEALEYREHNWRATEYTGGVIVIDTTEGGGFLIEAKELLPPARLRTGTTTGTGTTQERRLTGERIELGISPIAAGAIAAPSFDDDDIPF